MGNKFKISAEVRRNLLMAFDPHGAIPGIDPTRDFLTVGTPRDTRKDMSVAVEGNQPK